MSDSRKCKRCKQDKPLSEYFRPRKRGWTVKACNDCVKKNMKRYSATSTANLTNIERIKRGAIED